MGAERAIRAMWAYSIERTTELEALGGNIITLTRSEYRELLAA